MISAHAWQTSLERTGVFTLTDYPKRQNKQGPLNGSSGPRNLPLTVGPAKQVISQYLPGCIVRQLVVNAYQYRVEPLALCSYAQSSLAATAHEHQGR